MPARTLGALAITTALVLLPTAAQASTVPAQVSTMMATAERATENGVDLAGPTDPASTGSSDSLVVLGLAVLVGGALLLTLTGRRPDDDEPTD